MYRIIYLFLGVLIVTAFVYDCMFGIIPNYVVAAGVAGLVPIMYSQEGLAGLGFFFIRMFLIGVLLYVLYILGSMGAGDVKLISVVAACFSPINALQYIVTVLFCGGLCGVIKLVRVRKKGNGRTKIIFTVPVVMAYFIHLILKGGDAV